MGLLDGKVACITGAGRGVGRSEAGPTHLLLRPNDRKGGARRQHGAPSPNRLAARRKNTAGGRASLPPRLRSGGPRSAGGVRSII